MSDLRAFVLFMFGVAIVLAVMWWASGAWPFLAFAAAFAFLGVADFWNEHRRSKARGKLAQAHADLVQLDADLLP